MLLVISSDIHQLIGQGEEILVDAEGNLIAHFMDGNFIASAPVGNTEETANAA